MPSLHRRYTSTVENRIEKACLKGDIIALKIINAKHPLTKMTYATLLAVCNGLSGGLIAGTIASEAAVIALIGYLAREIRTQLFISILYDQKNDFLADMMKQGCVGVIRFLMAEMKVCASEYRESFSKRNNPTVPIETALKLEDFSMFKFCFEELKFDASHILSDVFIFNIIYKNIPGVIGISCYQIICS